MYVLQQQNYLCSKQNELDTASQMCFWIVGCSELAGQGRAGQGRAGQGRAGQGRAGQGRAGQGRTCEQACTDLQPSCTISMSKQASPVKGPQVA